MEPNPAQEQSKRLRRMRFGDRRFKYLTEPTHADLLMRATILPLIPYSFPPNALTVFRFISIPVILWLLFIGKDIAAITLFALSAFSDALDGALARTRYQITAWGIMADPIADKLLVGSVAFVVVWEHFGWLLAATIIGIEITLVLSSFFRYRGKLVPAKTIGKIKMILQCIGVGLVLLYAVFPFAPLLHTAEYTLYASVVFALLSLFVYRSI
ncbi:MAG: CDP-alcohol phosphatidyltransferase family protein [bacterium]|nr:CDP-alcohol phosphatidyltransferase family protein [bacterium]